MIQQERIEQAAANHKAYAEEFRLKPDTSFICGVDWYRNHQWIPVDEELPPIDEKCVGLSIDVIVRNEYGKVTTAWYSYSAQNWHLCYGEIQGDDLIYSKITHWMEIPTLQPSEQLP